MSPTSYQAALPRDVFLLGALPILADFHRPFNDGGGIGIRTLAPLTRPIGFQDRPLQPLGYSSKAKLGGP